MSKTPTAVLPALALLFLSSILYPAAGALLTGGIIGTPGSWNNSGNTITNVFDGNLTTFFDAPDPGNGDWAGLDFGPGANDVITAISFCPRSTFSSRMVGGVFQGANLLDFSDAVNLFNLSAAPTEGVMTTVNISEPTPFRYGRYLAPNGGYGNIAELKFYGYGPGVNLALAQPTTASSTLNSSSPSTNAVDGNPATSWASAVSDPQWLMVDLGSIFSLGSVQLTWGSAYAKAYQVQVSPDASTWTTIYSTTTGTGGVQTITFPTTSGRYVQMYGTQQGNASGYSLSEFAVYSAITTPVVATRPATNIQSTTATLNGQVVSTGGQIPSVVLYYGTVDGGTSAGTWAHSSFLGQQSGFFSAGVTNLVSGSAYYYTFAASNSIGLAWATPSASFTTYAPPVLPVVTNLPTANVQATSAQLSGQILSTGGGGETPTVILYYGTADGGSNPAAWANNIYVGSQTGQFTATLLGLAKNTTYYFTAAAANSAGTGWATPSKSFTTLALQKLVPALTYHYDNTRQGANTNETILTPANVNVNTFGKLFSYTVDGHVYSQPLLMTNVSIPGQGVHNVVYVATQHDSVYAFDADSNGGTNGGLLWHTNLGISSATPNNDYGNRYGPYHDINPEVGVTSTPVIDPVSGTLYLDVFTHEGTSYYHRIHALDIASGNERPGSPVVVSASVPGVGVGSSGGILPFDPIQHLQRPALTLAGNILFVAYSGYADTDPYHGWVLGFDATTLQLLPNYVFNTSPNSTIAAWGANAGECGLWMGGNGLSVDANTNLFFEVGNGPFNANTTGGTEYGDSFVKLSAAAGGLYVSNYFTPYNQASLSSSDSDLGSGGPILLPDAVGSATHPHLLVGCGKEGKIYLVDRDNMGGYNSANDSQIVQELPGAVGGTWSSPAYFNYRIYYQGNGDVLKAFSITNGAINPTPVRGGSSTGFPGATPSVSANGNQNGIVWVIQADAYSSGGPAVLHAYNATNVAQELYNSSQNLTRDNPGGAVKMTVPIVANGKVYMGAQFTLSVFGNGIFLPTPAIVPNGGTFTNSITVSITDSTPGVTIFYTLDGTAPTTNSLRYTAPFVLTNSAAVQAMAVKSGAVNSGVASASFLNQSAVGTGSGLLGAYYSNSYATNPFSGPPALTRTDTNVNFNWGTGSPATSISSDHFTVRWTGAIQPQFTEPYTLYATADDGVRVWVNGQLLIDHWVDESPTTYSAQLNLRAQQRYNIEMDYYENTGGAEAILAWSSPSITQTVIPQAQLYNVTNPPPGVVITSPTNGSAYTATASVTLGANAAAQYNAIDHVSFYANNALLGALSNAPYVFTATGMAPGSYSLTAVAVDGSGLSGTSAPVNITVSAGSGLAYGLTTRPLAPAFYNMPSNFNGLLPTKLSQTGVFADTPNIVPATGLIPYAPNTPLWSDGALKTRWMALPFDGTFNTPNQQIGFAPTGEWAFPTGTIFVKHFNLITDETNPAVPARRLETRLLVRDPNGAVYGVTYKWRPDNSDADLLTNSLNEDIIITNATGVRTQTWYYPSPADCLTCHTPAASYVLGVKTRQLNGSFTYPTTGITDNQLRTLNRLGLLNPAINEAAIPSYSQMVSVTNQSATLENRVHSYIDANCAQCHRPGGTGPTFDARYDTPLASANIINANVLGNLGYDNAHVVTPKDIWRSMLFQRANSTEPLIKMPPLARNLVDSNAMTVVTAWINSLPGTPALAPPIMSPAGGTFSGSVVITLEPPDTNATLYYTLDGTLPTTSSLQYSQPFTVNSSATVKANAFESGYNNSVATTGQFTILPGVYFTNSQRFTNGTFVLQLAGTPGRSYALQASTNLLNWIWLSTNVPVATPFTITDPSATNYTYRFYRAVELP